MKMHGFELTAGAVAVAGFAAAAVAVLVPELPAVGASGPSAPPATSVPATPRTGGGVVEVSDSPSGRIVLVGTVPTGAQPAASGSAPSSIASSSAPAAPASSSASSAPSPSASANTMPPQRATGPAAVDARVVLTPSPEAHAGVDLGVLAVRVGLRLG